MAGPLRNIIQTKIGLKQHLENGKEHNDCPSKHYPD